MDFQDKVHRIYERHLKLIVEWGGVDNIFTNCSDIDEDLAIKLFLAVNKDMSKETFDEVINEIVNEQNERESK